MGSIEVRNLGKAYKRYATKWARLLEWLDPSRRPRFEQRWVLRGVTFTVNSGEAVGIIGVNGAGKSTLLKLITGTVRQTEGAVTVKGRVAALLELGIGFHPEFTGRQNVITSAQLIGLSYEEAGLLMDEIVEFSGIGSMIDQPVRVYSSGMQVRLAFAVATAKRPDVLIVDEALSVGDIQFQQKCIERIKEFKKFGTTILFVTHDINALHAICDRSIVLDKAGCVFQGSTNAAVEAYFQCLAREKNIRHEIVPLPESSIESDGLYDLKEFIEELRIVDMDGNRLHVVKEEQVFCLELTIKAKLSEIPDPHIGFRIQDRLGLVVYESNTHCHAFRLDDKLKVGRGHKLRISLKNNLSQGNYTIAIGIEQGGRAQGVFDSVICVTKVIDELVVVRPDLSPMWAGSTNLRPVFTLDESYSEGKGIEREFG